MKTFYNYQLSILFAALFVSASCGGAKEYKLDAQGAPYEVVVVAGHGQWNGAVGDTLRSILNRQVPMVSRQETLFDILRVLPEGFNKLVTRHRNVLIINVDKQFAEPSLGQREDVYAAPQVVLVANASDNAEMAKFLGREGENILRMLERAEKNRDIKQAQRHTPQAVKERIREKFGIEMLTGPGFKIRDEKEGFLWISNEMPTASQGIIVYTYPFSGVKDFNEQRLIARRNEFAALVPGENPGSFMTTNPDYTELVFTTIDGHRWAGLHGFWDVRGDFMGGPFVNYSTLDDANGRVIAIDFYVYSPDARLSQRNFKNQLAHYLYTVKF